MLMSVSAFFQQRGKKILGIVLSMLLTSAACLIIIWAFAWPRFVQDHQILDFTLKESFFSAQHRHLRLEVVTSQEAIEAGLSSRSALLAKNGEAIDGMLFVFPEKTAAVFWMKGMLFDIDICWLSDDEILSCDAARAEQKDQAGRYVRFYSPGKIHYVLETAQGFLQASGQRQILYPSNIFSLL